MEQLKSNPVLSLAGPKRIHLLLWNDHCAERDAWISLPHLKEPSFWYLVRFNGKPLISFKKNSESLHKQIFTYRLFHSWLATGVSKHTQTLYTESACLYCTAVASASKQRDHPHWRFMSISIAFWTDVGVCDVNKSIQDSLCICRNIPRWNGYNYFLKNQSPP